MAARSQNPGIPEILPVMPLRSTVVFPTGVVGVQISMSGTLEMLGAHPEPGLMVAAVVPPGGPDDPIDFTDLQKIAVAVRVSDRLNLPGGIVQATLQGLQRVRLRAVEEKGGYLVARAATPRERPAPEEQAAELITRILNALEALSGQVDRISREIPRILRMNLGDPGRFADLVATLSNFSVASRDRVLQLLSVEARLRFACDELEAQLLRVRKISDDAAAAAAAPPVAQAADPTRRATDLRQQIKLLQAELGEVDPLEAETVRLLRRVEGSGLPSRAASRARSEIEQLRTGSSDVGEIRAYLDWLLSLPWQRSATEGPSRIDLAAVQQEMDRQLLGLTEPKERLLDQLAVARLRRTLGSVIPCIVGPPDTGKATLVEAMAAGLGRPLARLDLGGRTVGDLLGIRRTRGDAQPGRIAALLRDAQVNDPVVLLDEVDELTSSSKGEETGEALEEILMDPSHFMDRYLEVPFDLGNVLFVAVAHDFQKVPRALRERMVEIRIPGYTPEEKVEIARTRLLPRLIAEHGLLAGHVDFNAEGLYALAYGYARDAGVGALQRSVETLLRTRARARARGDASRWTFDVPRIRAGAGCAALRAHARGKRPGDRRGHGTRVDRVRRRADVHRSAAHAGQWPPHHHGPPGRRDARVRQCCLLVCAQPRPRTGHHRGGFPRIRCARPFPGGRHSQGWPLGRRGRDARDRVDTVESPRAARHGGVRRSHSARAHPRGGWCA